jgi:hypothetical protein
MKMLHKFNNINMTSKEANSISIKDFLADMNIHPQNRKSSYGMYFSPFRSETEPSLKVDFRSRRQGKERRGFNADSILENYRAGKSSE